MQNFQPEINVLWEMMGSCAKFRLILAIEFKITDDDI
jgi:hypothetical protein